RGHASDPASRRHRGQDRMYSRARQTRRIVQLPTRTRGGAVHVAVLLLTLSDNPRRTTFTRDWAERCVGVAGEYYAAQSAGQALITWQVFDWLDLAHGETAVTSL